MGRCCAKSVSWCGIPEDRQLYAIRRTRAVARQSDRTSKVSQSTEPAAILRYCRPTRRRHSEWNAFG
jgi:hypothetical protein